jgi:hypothetical protein
MRKVIGLLAGAAILGSVLIGAASASTGSNETIIVKRASDFSEIGWQATGAFIDAGSWTTDFQALSHGPVFAGTTKTTETNQAGTGSFSILFEIQGLPNTFQGNWKIISGTGIYAHLHGTGTWTEADDPVSGDHVFTLTGSVHFDP